MQERWRPLPASTTPSARLRAARSMPQWISKVGLGVPAPPPPPQQDDSVDPDYEVIDFPTQPYSNAPPTTIEVRVRRCDLCGTAAPSVQCQQCPHQNFCASCDQMYHRHPKRQAHVRKLLEGRRQESRPPLPPKGEPVAAPVPPPRRNKRGLPPPNLPTGHPQGQTPVKKESGLVGSIKRIITGRALPPPPARERSASMVQGHPMDFHRNQMMGGEMGMPEWEMTRAQRMGSMSALNMPPPHFNPMLHAHSMAQLNCPGCWGWGSQAGLHQAGLHGPAGWHPATWDPRRPRRPRTRRDSSSEDECPPSPALSRRSSRRRPPSDSDDDDDLHRPLSRRDSIEGISHRGKYEDDLLSVRSRRRRESDSLRRMREDDFMSERGGRRRDDDTMSLRGGRRKEDDLMSLRGGRRKDDDVMSLRGGRRRDDDISSLRGGRRRDDDVMSLRGGKRRDDDVMSERGGRRDEDKLSVRGGRRKDEDLTSLRGGRKKDDDVASISSSRRREDSDIDRVDSFKNGKRREEERRKEEESSERGGKKLERRPSTLSEKGFRKTSREPSPRKQNGVRSPPEEDIDASSVSSVESDEAEEKPEDDRPPAPIPTTDWECEHCTFVNQPGSRVCNVCCKTASAPKPVKPKQEILANKVEQLKLDDKEKKREQIREVNLSPQKKKILSSKGTSPPPQSISTQTYEVPAKVKREQEWNSSQRSFSRQSVTSDTQSSPLTPPRSRSPETDSQADSRVRQPIQPRKISRESQPADYLNSLVQKQVKQGLEMVKLLKEAEERQFFAEDVTVALEHCGDGDPVQWLVDNWRNMIDTVVTLGTNYGHERKENTIGTISSQEARDALRLHSGNVWAAVTECVQQRQNKYSELLSRGNFSRQDIVTMLTAHHGNLEAAYAELNKGQLKPFLMKIWGPPQDAEAQGEKEKRLSGKDSEVMSVDSEISHRVESWLTQHVYKTLNGIELSKAEGINRPRSDSSGGRTLPDKSFTVNKDPSDRRHSDVHRYLNDVFNSNSNSLLVSRYSSLSNLGERNDDTKVSNQDFNPPLDRYASCLNLNEAVIGFGASPKRRGTMHSQKSLFDFQMSKSDSKSNYPADFGGTSSEVIGQLQLLIQNKQKNKPEKVNDSAKIGKILAINTEMEIKNKKLKTSNNIRSTKDVKNKIEFSSENETDSSESYESVDSVEEDTFEPNTVTLTDQVHQKENFLLPDEESEDQIFKHENDHSALPSVSLEPSAHTSEEKSIENEEGENMNGVQVDEQSIGEIKESSSSVDNNLIFGGIPFIDDADEGRKLNETGNSNNSSLKAPLATFEDSSSGSRSRVSEVLSLDSLNSSYTEEDLDYQEESIDSAENIDQQTIGQADSSKYSQLPHKISVENLKSTVDKIFVPRSSPIPERSVNTSIVHSQKINESIDNSEVEESEDSSIETDKFFDFSNEDRAIPEETIKNKISPESSSALAGDLTSGYESESKVYASNSSQLVSETELNTTISENSIGVQDSNELPQSGKSFQLKDDSIISVPIESSRGNSVDNTKEAADIAAVPENYLNETFETPTEQRVPPDYDNLRHEENISSDENVVEKDNLVIGITKENQYQTEEIGILLNEATTIEVDIESEAVSRVRNNVVSSDDYSRMSPFTAILRQEGASPELDASDQGISPIPTDSEAMSESSPSAALDAESRPDRPATPNTFLSQKREQVISLIRESLSKESVLDRLVTTLFGVLQDPKDTQPPLPAINSSGDGLVLLQNVTSDEIKVDKTMFLEPVLKVEEYIETSEVIDEPDFKVEAGRLLVEGVVETQEQAEVAATLVSLKVPLEEAVQAAKECTSIHAALAYLHQECPLCTSKCTAKEMVGMLECDHKCCKECATNYFTLQVCEAAVWKCVCPFCGLPELRASSQDQAQSYFAHLDILLKSLLTEPVHELFQRKLRDWTLAQDPLFRWCPKCSSGFIAEPDQKRLMCPDCRAVTCGTCRRDWDKDHDGRSCEEFGQEQSDPEVLLAEHLKEHGITCPSCKAKYTLARGGCMHMTCSSCKHEFCSGCSKPFLMGDKCQVSDYCGRLGLHSHHPRNCLFYLRDKEPKELEKLLADHGVDCTRQVENPGSSRCNISLLKETLEGQLVDSVCGHFVVSQGLCRNHYVEHLGGLVVRHGVDPVPLMDLQQACQELRRWGKAVPERTQPSEAEYLRALFKIVEEEIPLE